MLERRSERRKRALKVGQVLLDGAQPVDCVVRDISPMGAHLEFEQRVELPDAFRLRLVTAALAIPVKRVWQRKLEAGVRFASEVAGGAA